MAMRDLAKIGITHSDQLYQPLPSGILATVKMAVRKDDDGTERNRVKDFQVTGIEAAEPSRSRPTADRATARRLTTTVSTGRRAARRGSRHRDRRLRLSGRWHLGRGDSPSIGGPPSPPTALATTGHSPSERRYLSHFTFGRDLHEYLTRTGSEKGFNGPCGADWLHWDIDRADDLDAALRDARRLAGAILDRYRELGDDDLLIFLSGARDSTSALPTCAMGTTPFL